MLRQRVFDLFCNCICGKIASFEELKNLENGQHVMKSGTRVRTHSLTSTEYNNLCGTVSGEAVVRKGVKRLPVVIDLSNGEKQIMALKEDNLVVVDGEESVFRVDTDPGDHLVVKGYFGLFSLMNENPMIVTDKEIGNILLKEMFTLREKMNPDTCPHAQYLIGECYEYGISDYLSRNTANAIEWYHKAAEQGHAGAQCELGYCYHNGESVEQDYAKGVQYYQLAADQGFAKAQYYMGVANFYGQGVETDSDEPEDYEAAVKWYHQSAEQGYAPAQCALGYCYQIGKGCSVNLKEAEKYFSFAANQGDNYANAKLSTLKRLSNSILT